MKKWFVYYNDDYDDMGGVGLHEAGSLEAALQFIESRLASKGTKGRLDEYTLIEGTNLQIATASQITKVIVKDSP